MRDRLIELLDNIFYGEKTLGDIADYLMENGVVALDMGVVSPRNRPLITHIAGMPLDDFADLINRQQAEIERLHALDEYDVVKVVRCMDCEYWQDNNDGYHRAECRWCKNETPDADDYCSFGERKESD